jgi:hypothetical protein
MFSIQKGADLGGQLYRAFTFSNPSLHYSLSLSKWSFLSASLKGQVASRATIRLREVLLKGKAEYGRPPCTKPV